MKRFYLVFVGLLLAVTVNAQSVKPLEFEVFGGVTAGLGKVQIYSDSYKSGETKIGFNAGVELRHNFANNFDIALQGIVANLLPKKGKWWLYASALVFADYHINMQSGILSVGFGAGVQDKGHLGLKDYVGYFDDQDEKTGFCVAPRVSYRISDHVRLSLTDYIANKTHNTLCLSVGYVF
ncbi:MAG: hypothetical protein Q4E60_00525 [Bacteroidales bacterium]|nr:hypothetical protein [Bacteroidales bacterium]